MYLESIALKQTLPCLAEPGKIIVTGAPDRSLADVLPYLATLPGVIAYNPAGCTLTFRRPRGFMTLYADQVYITQVRDVDEGLELLAALRDAVNATWEKRAELAAVETARRAPRHLDIWKLLPQTNCKACGEATCLAFAVKIVLQERELEECLPLLRDEHFAVRLATLRTLV